MRDAGGTLARMFVFRFLLSQSNWHQLRVSLRFLHLDYTEIIRATSNQNDLANIKSLDCPVTTMAAE